VICYTPDLAIDGMICELVEEITINQAVLDLSETPIEVFLQHPCLKVDLHRIQADSFHKFNRIQAFSFRIMNIFSQPMVVWWRLFACLI
jgi:hypothetical protein